MAKEQNWIHASAYQEKYHTYKCVTMDTEYILGL